MNVVLVTDNFPSNSYPTRGTFVANLARHLLEEGMRVEVVNPERRGSGPAKEMSQTSLVTHHPPYRGFPHVTLKPPVTTAWIDLFSFYRSAASAIRDAQLNPDLLYAHFLFPGGTAALRLAERRKLPVVVALGESSMEKWENRYGVKSVRRYLHRFSGVITVSQTLTEYCTDFIGLPGERVFNVPNAVDTERFFPQDREEARRELGLPQGAFIISFVGHFSERKGFRRVLAALELVPGAKAIFIGDGPEHPTGEQVLHAGPIHYQSVPTWLAASDIFVLPSQAEGASNAVNEALAMGLPVVISDIRPMREQVPDDAGLFVHPLSTTAIAEGIARLSRDEDLRQRMGKHAAIAGAQRPLQLRTQRIASILRGIVGGR